MLLSQLADYAVRHPRETEIVARFTEFVNAYADCFERSLAIGHVTGSAWIVDGTGTRTLLTHHRKLDRWLQLGGHSDGDPDTFAVAMREAREESGLTEFEAAIEIDGIFDLDIHPIPARGDEPEHFHYDVRFALRATGLTDYTVSDESHDLRWVPFDEVETLTEEESMLRMVRKWKAVMAG